MSMTKKDYETVAGILRDQREPKQTFASRTDEQAARTINNTLDCVAHEMARAFGRENGKFQPLRFLAACRGES